MSDDAARHYHERHGPQALVVMRDGAITYEGYGGSFSAVTPHALYSGTKSFWGITAAAAMEDGLLDLHEPVAATLGEFAGDALKQRLIVRQLLDLTAGYAFGGMGSAVPVAATALEISLATEPGTRFTYGGIPLQVFGEVLRRKLLGRSPHEYLRERVLTPAGVAVARWRDLPDGTQPLPTGAFLTARAWLQYGTVLLGRGTAGGTRIISDASFAAVAAGSTVNPRYGLGLWHEQLLEGSDVLYASGAGGQALYVLPTQRCIAVRFGNGKSWNHAAFLRALAT